MAGRGLDEGLVMVHGRGKCHICKKPKAGPGSEHCSYPHGMMPDKPITGSMWSWKVPETDTKE